MNCRCSVCHCPVDCGEELCPRCEIDRVAQIGEEDVARNLMSGGHFYPSVQEGHEHKAGTCSIER